MSDEGAAGEDMVNSFISLLADFSPSILQDVFVNKRRSAVYPFFGEQPSKEFHARGSKILPNELEGGAGLVTLR